MRSEERKGRKEGMKDDKNMVILIIIGLIALGVLIGLEILM